MFRAVHDRCFVDFTKLNLPISSSETLQILRNKGFRTIDVDIIDEARALINKAEFRLRALTKEAPFVFDCSSFTKWLYGRKGIWIPRLAVQQFEYAAKVDLDSLQQNDLVFTSGYCSRAWHVGHVGLYTGNSVITAMIQKTKSGVVEIPLATLLSQRTLRGIGRILPSPENTTTIITPSIYEVDTSDDIKHLVLSWTT